MALDAAGHYVARQGGVDTNAYLAVLRGYADAYRLLGAVLLGVGAFRALQPA